MYGIARVLAHHITNNKHHAMRTPGVQQHGAAASMRAVKMLPVQAQQAA